MRFVPRCTRTASSARCRKTTSWLGRRPEPAALIESLAGIRVLVLPERTRPSADTQRTAEDRDRHRQANDAEDEEDNEIAAPSLATEERGANAVEGEAQRQDLSDRLEPAGQRGDRKDRAAENCHPEEEHARQDLAALENEHDCAGDDAEHGQRRAGNEQEQDQSWPARP